MEGTVRLTVAIQKVCKWKSPQKKTEDIMQTYKKYMVEWRIKYKAWGGGLPETAPVSSRK